MKRNLALLLALVMVFVLFAGCGNTSDAGTQDTAKEDEKAKVEEFIDSAKTESKVDDVIVEHEKPIQVTVALSNSAVMFSPIMIVNPYNNIIGAGVYERLAEREQYGSDNFRGVLLKSWEASADGYTYTCELYDYIKDADGNAFTTEDLEYALKMQAEAAKTLAKKVEKLEIIDDYKFAITLTENYEGFWIEFCEGLLMFTKEAYEKSLADNSICVGTGPYKCIEFMSNSYAIVEKTNAYWQTPELTTITSRANVDRIRYNIVTEVTQMAIAVDSPDDTQMCGYIVESLVGDALANSEKNGVDVTSIESTQTKIINFNTSENSPFQNEDLRKAVAYALNNELCISTTYKGIGFIPKTLGVPQLMDWKPEWEEGDYYSYNAEKAREHFKLAGYDPDNVGLTLTWMGVQNAQNESNGAWVAGCLAEYGITVETSLVEAAASNTYRTDLASGWDLFESGGTPANLYNYLFLAGLGDATQNGGHPRWGEADDELQALIEKVKTGDEAAFEEYRNYLIDNCLIYQYAGVYFTVTHVNTITNLVTDYRNSLVVGACTFAEDYPYVIE